MTTNTIAKFILITMVAAVGKFSMVSGQSSPVPTPASAPGPTAENCLVAIGSAQDCLTFISNDSNETKPDKRCCPEVRVLVTHHLTCVCQVIGQAATYNINVSKALELPMVCNVNIPGSSLCPPGPSASPTGSQPAASAAPGGTIPSGSSSSPTGGGGNGASGGAVVSVFALATALGAAVLPIFF